VNRDTGSESCVLEESRCFTVISTEFARMFKKLLMVLGVGALLAVGAFVTLLFWAQHAGAELHDKFFNAVVSGDPQQVLNLCDPSLREEVDAPVLGAWMNEVRGKLGGYRGLSKSNFDTNMKATDQGRIIESKGTIHFEHGDAASELTFRNDLLTAFSIKSDKLAGEWFKGPAETKLYRERGEQFIRKFFAQDKAGAAAMMGKELHDVVPDEKLVEFMKTITAQSGALKTVLFREEKVTTDAPVTLRIYYDLECEKEKLAADVKFQFIGLKGHFEGFNFKPMEE